MASERNQRRRKNQKCPPGPLQRQVLRVLHGVKLLAEASPERRPTKSPSLFTVYIPPVTAALGQRYGRGVSAKEIARILSDAPNGHGVQTKVQEASVSAALSGMMVNGGRYWVSKHPGERWTITRNGLAWL